MTVRWSNVRAKSLDKSAISPRRFTIIISRDLCRGIAETSAEASVERNMSELGNDFAGVNLCAYRIVASIDTPVIALLPKSSRQWTLDRINPFLMPERERRNGGAERWHRVVGRRRRFPPTERERDIALYRTRTQVTGHRQAIYLL